MFDIFALMLEQLMRNLVLNFQTVMPRKSIYQHSTKNIENISKI